jgi:hypothetical protein
MKEATLGLAVLLLVGAVRAESSWERLEGEHSGITQPLIAAVKDQATWASIWRRHDADDPVPAVDFRTENVVVVFLGEKRAAGAKVRVIVQQDMLDADRLNVFYKEIDAKKPFVADVLCQPFAIVKVKRAAVIDLEPDGAMSIPEHTPPPERRMDAAKFHALQSAPPNFDGR